MAFNCGNFAYAKKTPEEKAAAKEAKQLKKQAKELAKKYRKTNILKVEEWATGGDEQAKLILAYAKDTHQHVVLDKEGAAVLRDSVRKTNPDLVKHFVPVDSINKPKVLLPRLYGYAAARSQTGNYVKQNFDDAIRWAELGASEFDTLSYAVLSSAYYTGRGYRQDYKKAIEYAKLAKNEPIALTVLADAYEKGNGVDLDLKRSQFYKDYLRLITQPKIDKKRAKNEKILERQERREEKERQKQEKREQREREKQEKEKEKQAK